MKEELIEYLYRDWIVSNPESKLLFSDFKRICKCISNKCSVEERQNATIMLGVAAEQIIDFDKIDITFSGGEFVLRESSPRVLLIIEE